MEPDIGELLADRVQLRGQVAQALAFATFGVHCLDRLGGAGAGPSLAAAIENETELTAMTTVALLLAEREAQGFPASVFLKSRWNQDDVLHNWSIVPWKG